MNLAYDRYLGKNKLTNGRREFVRYLKNAEQFSINEAQDEINKYSDAQEKMYKIMNYDEAEDIEEGAMK